MGHIKNVLHRMLRLKTYSAVAKLCFNNANNTKYSTDSVCVGGGGTNISERRTPLSHLLGRCAPPRRVTLHRGGGGVRVRHAAGGSKKT